MAETEVSKEVSKMVAIEEKCVSDMSSYQDLPKPDCNGTNHHNQASDLDNSYVFVSGTDGVTEDVGSEDVKSEDSRVLPESDAAGVKDQAAELEFQPLNEEEGILERSNGDPPLINVDSKDVEAEGLSALSESDAAGVKDQATELDSQIEINDAASGELNEAENSTIGRGNGDLPLVNPDNKDAEAEGLSVLPESGAAGVKDQEADLHSGIEKIDNGEIQAENIIIERSSGDSPLVNVDNEDVEAQVLSVLPEPEAVGVKDQEADLHSEIENIDSAEIQAESSIIERCNGDPPFINVDNEDVEAKVLSVLPEPEATVVKDQGADLHSQAEKKDAVSVEFQPLNEAENSIIEQSNGDPSLANIDKKVVEDEGLSVLPESDATGLKGQGTELHSQIDVVGENVQPLNESENSITGDPPLVNVNDKDVVEAEGSSVLPESDAVGLKDQEAELRSQYDKIDAVSQPLNETENRIVEQSNWESSLVNIDNKDMEAEGSSVPHEPESAGVKEKVAELDPQSLLNFDNKDVEAEGSSVVFEPNAAEIKDPGAELGSNNESYDAVESRNVEQINEDPTSVNGSNSKHESFLENGEGVQVSLDGPLVEHAGETNTETEIKDVQVEGEVEKALDQNGIVEFVAEDEEEKCDNVSNAESSPDPVVNQVSQVVALGLAAESGENRESNNILVHINNSLTVNGECEVQSNLETRHESQEMVGQRELQDGEVKLVKEVVESVENKVSPATSLDLASHAVHSKAETLDEEAKTALSSEVFENQQDETAFGNNVQGVLGHMDESKAVGSCIDSHVQTVVEEQNENSRVTEVDNGVQYPEENNEQPDSSGVSHDTITSETKTEASMQTQSEISDVETIGAAPIVCPKSHITENLSPSYDSGIRRPDEVVLTEKEPASQGDEAHAETEVSSGKVETAVCPPVLKQGREERDDTAVSCRTEVSDSFNVNNEAANVMLDVEGTEDIRDQLDGATDSVNKNLFVQENEDTGNSQCSNVSVASAGVSSGNTSNGKEQSVKIKTKPFNFLIRVPRFDDENLREQIRVAKIHVDEKTKLREAVQIQIQEKRANSQVHGIDYEYAKSEARSARKLVRSKRMEIDSLQSVINKAKNALSIEDIDSQIYNMEHMIQHETLPLKEEKQLIREIKQLKQLREQLSSNMGSQDEIKQAIEQRGEVEERLKILRKELDILKNKVLKAEATAAEAEKKYDDENKKVRELQAQFRAADDVRQAAYAQWQNLRKELSKKSEYFFKYKDDAAVANNYAYSRDTEALYLLCTNQVDNFMGLWNTNDEFRREYAKFNTRSTVRRFGTLDGRALGPDEVPPRLPSYADERASRMASTSPKVDLAARIPSPEVKQEMTNENTTVNDKPKKKATESNYQKVTKEPAITVQANGLDTHSVEVYKEPIRSKDEIESLRREEEKRREEAEAKLKEQRRVEALVKANEARERKKRQAEKLQMRADLKTQKEAEQREKEREKRLRKKERKKGGVTDGNDMKSINCESGPSSESAAESSKDVEVVNETVSKKQPPQKPWLLGKQSKGKSIPPPLRNRNKKKLQQWMWVGVTSVMILVLFWLGNIGVFSNVALKRRGPIH